LSRKGKIQKCRGYYKGQVVIKIASNREGGGCVGRGVVVYRERLKNCWSSGGEVCIRKIILKVNRNFRGGRINNNKNLKCFG